MKCLIIFPAVAIAVTALPTAAQADDGAPVGVRISLSIPEVCQIEASAISVDASSGRATGSVFEMCNSGRGFRVTASYRTLADGEEVRINYAGEISQLDATGMSALAYRSGPVVGHVPVSIQSSGLTADLAISLGLTII